MGNKFTPGFTIIETLLFLSITGLLIIGVIIGVGTSVNTQRYRDASESFKAFVQDQYAGTMNVQNARDNNWHCNSGGGVESSAGGEIRGQSNCMIVGRYVRIQGGDISIHRVLAREVGSAAAPANDIQALTNKYVLNISKVEYEERKMEWGTKINWTKDGIDKGNQQATRSIAMLFVRSPESGRVYTFTSNSILTNVQIDGLSATSDTARNHLRGMITVSGQEARALCVESDGLFDPGKNAVYIAPYAAGSTSVELLTNDGFEARGMATRC